MSFAWIAVFCSVLALAEPVESQKKPSPSQRLSLKLDQVQKNLRMLHQEIAESESQQKNTKGQIERIRRLKELQAQESRLTSARIQELESEIESLRLKRGEVELRRDSAKRKLQSELSELFISSAEMNGILKLSPEQDSSLLTKKIVLAQWLQLRLKDFEAIRLDFEDALSLELKIQEEKTRLEQLRESIAEQESLLTFHQKIREEMNAKRQEEHLRQLNQYQKLRSAQDEIERMLDAFHSRQSEVRQKESTPLLRQSPSTIWEWPVAGKVLTLFGPAKEFETGLQIFRKGIEIEVAKDAPVLAAMDGTVQFVGRLPARGNVMILSHVGEFYSLYGQVSAFKKQMGDAVSAKEEIALSDSSGMPLYFEIRSRNLALDPLKWLKGVR